MIVKCISGSSSFTEGREYVVAAEGGHYYNILRDDRGRSNDAFKYRFQVVRVFNVAKDNRFTV